MTAHLFTVARSDLERAPLSVVLEMLQYDRAHPVWQDGQVVVFEMSLRPPTRARWQSVGLLVWDVDLTDPSQPAASAADLARHTAGRLSCGDNRAQGELDLGMDR